MNINHSIKYYGYIILNYNIKRDKPKLTTNN